MIRPGLYRRPQWNWEVETWYVAKRQQPESSIGANGSGCREGGIQMDPAEMLTLAAITYRGCEFNLSNAHSRKIVYDEVARCLNIFGATRGKWELAWGPAGYRPGITGADISAMYAVRAIGASSASNL